MSIAFPFINVAVDTSGLALTARRAPGVLAIVGLSDQGSAAANVPTVVGSIAEAAAAFAQVDEDGAVTQETPLFRGLVAAMTQSPGPTKIYGVKVAADVAPGLAALEAVDDVTFVALAGVTATDPGDGDGADAVATNPGIAALVNHVNAAASAGNKRIAVAAISPALAEADYAAAALRAVEPFRSSRLVVLAARGAQAIGRGNDGQPVTVEAEVACAGAAAIAGLPPAASIVLKRVGGFTLPIERRFSPTETTALAGSQIVPIIDPALIVGQSLHFAEGTTFTDDSTLQFVDVVRLLDDLEFRLKAGLINKIGNARITKQGLSSIIGRAEGILSRLVGPGGIDRFSVRIPVYELLTLPPGSLTAGQIDTVNQARSDRAVDMFVSVTLGPAVHSVFVRLAPNFV